MDAKGRLIITDEDGNETFRGDSFEEAGMNRKKRRKEAAINRKRKRENALKEPAENSK